MGSREILILSVSKHEDFQLDARRNLDHEPFFSG